MKLDPDTTVAELLAAIPSSTLVFSKFEILSDPNENRTLQQICADHGIEFEQFLGAMNEIDWNKEVPAIKGSHEG